MQKRKLKIPPTATRNGRENPHKQLAKTKGETMCSSASYGSKAKTKLRNSSYDNYS